jgi:sporadic carbohydrate cluster protein (TIGR04323 family)
MNNKAQGYRGYIGSRPYDGVDFPQNVQNFLIRSYCQKHQLTYLLSATEYTMPGCHMILEQVLGTLDSLDGIVLFSIFMLPQSAQKRKRIYTAILNTGRSLHAALEDIAIKDWTDVPLIENILDLNKIALTKQSLAGLHEFCLTGLSRSVKNTEFA